MAPELAKGLGNAPDTTLVVAGPLESDVPAPKGEELVTKVAALVAGKLGPGVRAHPQSASLAAARGVASKSAALVFLRVVIDKGQLRVTADEYPVVANAWDRIRLPPPPPTAHAFAAAPVDPEIRAAMTPILLEQASVHKAKHDEGEVLAAACGDVDGDGGMDLVLVSRARVALGKLKGGQFVATKVAPWSSLSPRAAVPLREPIAGATLSFDRIAVATTDRTGTWLDGSLAPRGTLHGVPVGGDACARPVPEAGALGDLLACADGDAPAWTLGASRYDAISLYDGTDAHGAAVRMSAVREPSAKLRMRLGDREYAKPIDGVGAQVAVADLDLDGVPEIVTTADTGEDAITIASADATGPRARARFAAPDGVRALCVCPPEDKSAPALVAVVGGEVWLVR